MRFLRQPQKRFLSIAFALIFIALGIVPIFNFLVDPFNLYHFRTIKGFNDIKDELGKHERLYKPLEIIQQRPKGILLGSSRAAHGFDVKDIENIVHEPVYNAGLSGANFDEIYETFLHALYIQPDLKYVIIGIDLFAFNKNRKNQADFSLDRLQKNSMTYKDRLTSLLTFQALSASIKTVKKSFFHVDIAPELLTKEQIEEAHKASNEILRVGEMTYLQAMINTKEYYREYTICQDRIEKFAKLVDTCKAKGIVLKVFVSPIKAIYSETYYQHHLWPVFEQLKRELSSIYPIWDFSGYNAITTEAFESEGEPLYFECSHYTPYTGRLLLSRLFDLPTACQAGYLLTPETIESSLAAIRQERSIWAEQNIESVQKVQNLQRYMK